MQLWSFENGRRQLSCTFFSQIPSSFSRFNPDGLYVLLKPQKKRKNSKSSATPDRSKIPDHLTHYAIPDDPPETCPWSLSGPQFPQPTAIQQRYCYPKGNPEYSSRKGGALWTMYGCDGKEDLEFRLLHVYFSAKRAVNKGMKLSADERAKHQQSPPASSTPQKRRRTTPRSVRSPWQEGHQNHKYLRDYSPMSCASSRSSRSTNRHPPSSPLPLFDRMPILPPPSPCCRPEHENNRSSIFVSPNTAASVSEHANTHVHHDDGLFDHLFHPVPSFELQSAPGKPSPFRSHHDHPYLELFRNPENATVARGRRVTKDNEDDATAGAGAGFDCHDMDDASSLVDLDAYWNDPLFALMTKPSMDHGETHSTTQDNACQSLSKRLQGLNERIRDVILASPATEQGSMVSLVANWARSIAQSPLELCVNDENENHEIAVGTGSNSINNNNNNNNQATTTTTTAAV
jgi:hypothetical protein